MSNATFGLLLATLAGLSTGIGSLIAYLMPKPRPRYMSMLLGFSAGVMLYVSFVELLHEALDKIGFINTNIGFFVGIIFIALIDILIPHEYKYEHAEDSSLQKTLQLKKTAMLMLMGITIHNLPEGLAVFSSTAGGNGRFGILVAIAIALHNIPEGISVSIPIMEVTSNRRRAFVYSLGSGLAEPLGALIGFALLLPFLNDKIIYTMLAFSAGIMVYISLDELLPAAHQYGREHSAILGVMAGMVVMAVSIFLLN
jgi:ZIP family zinc transporter